MNPPEQASVARVRVFISYSHDSPEHCDQVLALAQQLRRDGIDAKLDQFEESPGQGWPLWCARQILDSQYVLLICTELYRKSFLGLEDFGKSRGVKWEANVIQNILYYKEINTGFIPVIFHDSDKGFIPETVREVSWYLVQASVDSSPDYAKLRQRLRGEKRFPPLGIPVRVEAYRQHEDISVPTEDVWKSSDRIEKKLDELRKQVGEIKADTSEIKVGVDEIKNKILAPAPAYKSVGAEAFAASQAIFDEIARKPFYGRTAELAWLDQFLAERDRGVVLLRGEAGMGKSTLAARWAERCSSDAGTAVLRHAFSVREARAGTRVGMVESLVRQVVSLLGAEELGEGEPGDARRLEDRLVTLLGRDQPEGTRVIVILDALDEAAETIEPWSTNIGHGVYLLVTCRAEEDETPAVLRTWHQRFQKIAESVPNQKDREKDGVLAREYPLSALDAAAIAAWLTAEESRQFEANDPLVIRVLEASEGVALFASFLIPHAIEQLRAGAIDPLLSSFTDYAFDQLDDLRSRIATPTYTGRWSWQYVRNLFALLAVAKGPLPPILIEKLSNGATLDELDQRVERWLWRRPKMVSLAHPRLAPVFASVLPRFDVDIEEVEDWLVRECEQAWSVKGNNGLKLKAYALTWLPAHLISLKRLDEAANLLGNGAFHFARLALSPDEATVHRTASETVTLDRRYVGANKQNLVEWRRFWSETEGPLIRGVANAGRFGLQPTDIFVQMAKDRLGSEASALLQIKDALPESYPATPCIARPCGFQHPFLLRTVDDAHRGAGDVFALDGRRLVSWGVDGAIRFWDRDGQPIPGGDPAAHPYGVGGVLPLSDERLVSWGVDGAIRFWNRDGQPIPGGDPAAHLGWVEGVLSLEDGRLVSWGKDDVIRVWDRWGVPKGVPWFAPSRLEGVTVVVNDVWPILLGRPFRLILGTPQDGVLPK